VNDGFQPGQRKKYDRDINHIFAEIRTKRNSSGSEWRVAVEIVERQQPPPLRVVRQIRIPSTTRPIARAVLHRTRKDKEDLENALSLCGPAIKLGAGYPSLGATSASAADMASVALIEKANGGFRRAQGKVQRRDCA